MCYNIFSLKNRLHDATKHNISSHYESTTQIVLVTCSRALAQGDLLSSCANFLSSNISHSREAQHLAVQCKALCASVLSKRSTENIVKSVTAGNHSILALSKNLPANRSTFLHKACLRFFNYSDTSLPSHSFLRIKGIQAISP